jgi:hypothetical protein
MTDAEPKKLEDELTGKKKLLAELEARLTATPQGGTGQQMRTNFKARIKQVRRDIAHVQQKLAARSDFGSG